MFPLAPAPSITFTLRPPRPAPPRLAQQRCRRVESCWPSVPAPPRRAQHRCTERDREWERCGERWRMGGAVCHEKSGLCNLWACPASHPNTSQLLLPLGSSLETMQTLPPLLPRPSARCVLFLSFLKYSLSSSGFIHSAMSFSLFFFMDVFRKIQFDFECANKIDVFILLPRCCVVFFVCFFWSQVSFLRLITVRGVAVNRARHFWFRRCSLWLVMDPQLSLF